MSAAAGSDPSPVVEAPPATDANSGSVAVEKCPICTQPRTLDYASAREAIRSELIVQSLNEVDDLQRRIERTIEYAGDVAGATNDATLLMVMDAVVASLTRPAASSSSASVAS